MMKISLEIIDKIRKIWIDSQKRVEETRQKLINEEKEEKLWNQLINYWDKNLIFHIINLLENNKELVEELKFDKQRDISFLEEIQTLVKEEAKNIIRNYPKLFEDACKKSSFEIDWDSSHPVYKLKKGFFTIKIDEHKGLAKIYDYEGKIAELPADIDSLIYSLKKENKRIFERKFDGKKFLHLIRKNYLYIIKKQNKTDGSSIRIRDITKRLGKNKKGFRTDEFLVDLSRLIKEGPIEIDGRKLDLQQIKGDKGGMLLYEVNISGYVGYISFKEV